MPPVRTGTASQVTASAGSGTTSVTVPADATGAVAAWAQFNSLGASTLSTLTLGGSPLTTRSEIACKTPSADRVGVGVATLFTLPGTGSQTLEWAWSDTDARDEGGGIFVAWIKNFDTVTPFRDADTVNNSGSGAAASRTVDSETTDLVLALIGSDSPTNPTLDGSPFISNVTINSQIYDMTDVTPNATSTTVNGTGDFPGLAVISIRGIATVDTGLAWIRA